MKFGIEGKTALVCGASKGLGRACAEALAEEGVRLVIVARNPDALRQTAGEMARQYGTQVIPVAADVTAADGRARVLGAARELCEGPGSGFDIVVTNAGGPPPGDYRELTLAQWNEALNANMLSPIEIMRCTVERMIKRRWGRIVNITSSAVKAPSPYLSLSNGSRAGLTGFVAGFARQVAPMGVTVNNLLPGTFATDRLAGNLVAGAKQAGIDLPTYTEMRTQAVPARRFGDPSEFGAACAFLCSQQAAYITAQNLLIDGGTYPGTF